MIRHMKVVRRRPDTRLYCNLVYTNAWDNNAAAIPLHLHLICPAAPGGECFPLIVYIGGGGWRTSHPDRHLPELSYYASCGFAEYSLPLQAAGDRTQR